MITTLLLVLIGVGLWLLYSRTPGLARETLHRVSDFAKFIGRTHIVNPMKGLLK